MTEDAKPPNGKAAPLPAITLTFAGPGQSDCVLSVTPGVKLSQVMAAAFLLDCVARELRAGEAAKDAMRQLALPGAELPPELARLLRG